MRLTRKRKRQISKNHLQSVGRKKFAIKMVAAATLFSSGAELGKLANNDFFNPTITADAAISTAQQNFINQIKGGAVKGWRYGVLPSITMAQAIVESGWGQSGLAQKGHNLFGIKYSAGNEKTAVGLVPGQPYIEYPTQEWDGSKYITVNAKFRNYVDWNASVEDHAKFLVDNARYKPCLWLRNYREFATALKAAGYATSPTYAQTLSNAVEVYNFTQYDREAGALSLNSGILLQNYVEAETGNVLHESESYIRDIGSTHVCTGRDISGYKTPITQVAKIGNTVTIVTFKYIKNVANQAALIQKYVDSKTGAEIREYDVYSRQVGSTHNCSPKAIEGYQLPANQTATVGSNGTIVTFKYESKYSKLTQKYVDDATGKEIHASEIFEREIGSTHLCTPRAIAGYLTPSNKTATIGKDGTTITFRYAPKPVTLMQKYIDAATGKEIHVAEKYERAYGSTHMCTPREIPGYNNPVNQTAVMGLDGATVTFYYLPTGQKAAPKITYQAHSQNKGWLSDVGAGGVAGTSGLGLRAEALNIHAVDGNLANYINIETHVQNIGWAKTTAKLDDLGKGGTQGQGLRMEALKVKLTPDFAPYFDIYYCTHIQNIGWQDWVKNGEISGTEGKSLRLEAYDIVIVPKGAPKPAKIK
jgi:flagellum-specific peptidoglycan hydrolase FlgJ